MQGTSCKLILVPGSAFQRPRLTFASDRADTERRQALADRVREAKIERVLTELGAERLPEDEARVLRVMVHAAVIGGPLPKAWQIAADADVTLKQLEGVCDRLLARGLIGPGVSTVRRRSP